MNIDSISSTQQDAYVQYIAEATEARQAWESLAEIREIALTAAPKVAQRTAARASTTPMAAGVTNLAPYLGQFSSYYFEPQRADRGQVQQAIRLWHGLNRLNLAPSGMIAVHRIWLAEWSREFSGGLGLDPVRSRLYLESMATVGRFYLSIVLDYLTEIAAAETTQNQNRLLNGFLAATGLSRELFEQMAKIPQVG